MASYQPQILDAPPQYGFLSGLAGGLSSGFTGATNAYGKATIEDKFQQRKDKRRQSNIDKYEASMQDMEVDKVTFDSAGNPQRTYKRKETAQDRISKNPIQAIKEAMLGIDPEGVGQAMGIQPQTPMTPIDPGAPPMSQYNDQGGEYMNYGDTVKKSLMDQYAPGYKPEQVQRDIMGLPAQTEQEKMQSKQKTYDPATTAKVQQNIKSGTDVDELLKNREDYEDAGVDVMGILKNYINTPQADPGIVQKVMSYFGGG